MNQAMWRHAAVQANLAVLRGRGVHLIGPDAGEQACGDIGPGRMSEVAQIVDALADLATATAAPADCRGLTVVISAGPTYEDIDPVRFIGNRSSGRMGFAIAEAAAARGATVRLVAGPVRLPTPAGVDRTDVRSAAQMRAAVLDAVADCDIYVGAAAVADYTPAEPLSRKLKKTDAAAVQLQLTRTHDILSEVAALARRPFVVGFAAETNDVLAYARDKLERKRLDLIAANQVGSPGCAFDADDNEITVLWAGGQQVLARDSKTVLAHRLLDLVLQRRAAAAGGAPR
jgi:phosphopantothenoylcysteine decarboxylase/phosphopantothenate--cysteine ligase